MASINELRARMFDDAPAGGDVRDLIGRIADETGVPRPIALALAEVESGLNPEAVGPETRHGRAQGLYQIMPKYAEDYGVSNPLDPVDNASGALRTLRANYDRFGSWDKAIAAHHAGAAAVERAGGVPSTADANMTTADYVGRVLERAGEAEAGPAAEAPRLRSILEMRAAMLEADKPAPDTSSNFVRGIKDAGVQLRQTAYGVGAMAADAAWAVPGALEARDKLLGKAVEDQQIIQSRRKPTDEFTNILDNEGSGLGAWVSYTAGNVLTQFLPSIVAGGVGAVAGRALAKEGVEQLVKQTIKDTLEVELRRGATLQAATAVAERAAVEAGKKALTSAGTVGAVGLNTAQSIGQEVGQIYPEAVSEAGGAANVDTGRVLGAGVVAGGIESLADTYLGGKLLKGSRAVPGTSLFARAQRMGAEGLAGSAIEGGTEGVQTGIERFGAKQSLTDEEARRDYINSAAAGALGGGIIGTAAGYRAPPVESKPAPAPRTAADATSPAEAAALPITPVEGAAPAVEPQAQSGAQPRQLTDDVFGRMFQSAEEDLNALRVRGVLPSETSDGRNPQLRAPAINTNVETSAEPSDADLLAKMAKVKEPKATGSIAEEVERLRQAGGALQSSDGAQVFVGKTFADSNKWQIARGRLNDSNRRQLLVDPSGGYFWGEWKDGISREGERVPVGRHASFQRAEFDNATQAREAAAATNATEPKGPGASAVVPAEAIAIDRAAHEAAPSPQNDLPEPTPAQKEAGNYKKGHIKIGGLDISVENPQGSERKGTDRSGKPWSVTMQHHYGYIKGTVGRDKDHIDAFVKPGTPEDWNGPVFVVDQKNPDTGRFDEHKVMVGFASEAEAEAAYRANYAKDWKGLGNLTATTLDGFKQWTETGNTKRPFADARVPTVDVMQQAIAKVGPDRFEELVAAHMEQFAGEDMEPAEQAAEIEGVARNVVDGAYDEAPTPSAQPEVTATTETANGQEGQGQKGVLTPAPDQSGAALEQVQSRGEKAEPGDRFTIEENAVIAAAIKKIGSQSEWESIVSENADPLKKYSEDEFDRHTVQISREIVAGEFDESPPVPPSPKELAKLKKELDQRAKAALETEGQWDYPTMAVKDIHPKPAKTVDAVKAAAGAPTLSLDEAKAVIEGWKAEAKRVGREQDNSNKVVISLFDHSGTWSKPFEDAGYDVRRYDIKNGDDLLTWFPNQDIAEIKASGKEIVGVLAAPPCTSFASSGARWWKDQHDKADVALVEKKYGYQASKYFDTPLEYAQALVAATEAIIELANPTEFHATENPVGRIQRMTGLPNPLLTFDPNIYGDPYTKKTQLWGSFNPNLPVAKVEPTQGSLMHKLRSGDEKDGGLRSLTPEGFAYAFFMANHGAAAVQAEPKSKLATEVEKIKAKNGRQARDWTEIGKNAAGMTLYEDQNGVRSYIENGVRVTESVAIIPGRGIAVDKERRSDDYKLVSEVSQAPAATPISKQGGAVEATNKAFAEARKMLGERYNVMLSADTNMRGERFLTASVDGKDIPQIRGTGYTEAGVKAAVGWVERNLKAREVQTPEQRAAADAAKFGEQIAQADRAARAEVEGESKNTVDALMAETRRYASGLSRLSDLKAGTRSVGGLDLSGVGVDVGQLSKNGIEELARAIVDLDAAVFVDSGAFSAFRRGLKSGDAKPMDFDAVLARYDEIEQAISAANPAEKESYPRPLLVMPDVVGDQAASLALVEKYKQWIETEARFNLARPIVPIQKGALSLADAYRQIVSILRTDEFIVGIPSNEEAVSPDELTEFLREVKPRAIHILGAASDKTLRPRLQSVIDAGLAGQVLITADASPIRSKIIRDVAAGKGRAEAIEERLFDKNDPSLARDYGRTNTVFTEEAAQRARDLLRKKLGQVSIGVDPEILQAGITLAGYHIEAGARTFAAYAKAMIADLGDVVKPYLKSWYMGVKYDPRAAEFSGQMTTAQDVEAFDLTRDIDTTPAEEQTGIGATDETSTRTEGQETLAGMAAEENGRPEGERPVRGSDTGRGQPGAIADRGPDEAGVSGTRGRRSRATATDTAAAGTGGGRVGRGSRGKRGAGSRVSEDNGPLFVTPGNVPAANYRIGADVRLGQGGESEKFRDNIAAIRTLKTLERENRRATADEQRILARYVGWGGLANAFADGDGNFKDGWKDRGTELAGLLTPEELRAARRTTRNAHYTSETIVRGMWDIAKRLGFKGGLAFESSAGTGNFLGLIPDEFAGNTRFVAVEYDSVTARIAAALYPQETVLKSGLQDVPIPDGEFLLNIGNPPFGSESLRFQYKPEFNGHSIHNQFFLAGLDALAPGGLQIGIVSRYLMDAQSKESRLEIAKRAKLLGAIRLPDVAFKENARTEVVTDILIFQKRTAEEQKQIEDAIAALSEKPASSWEKRREQRRRIERIPEWVETDEVSDPLGGEPIVVNRYFAWNPERIIGTLERSGSMRYENDVTVRLDKGADLGALLAEAIDKLPRDVMDDVGEEIIKRTIERHASMSEALKIAISGQEVGHIEVTPDGKLTQIVERQTPAGSFELTKRELTELSPWSRSLLMDEKGQWYTLAAQTDEKGAKVKQGKRNVYERKYFEGGVPLTMRLGEARMARLRELVNLRDLTKRQLTLEADDDLKGMEDNRKRLANAYQSFVDKHGFLNDPSNSALVYEMPDGALVLALETGYRPAISEKKALRIGEKPRAASANRAPILKQRVVPKYEPATTADSPADALAITLAERGRVDTARIAGLLGLDEKAAIDKLTAGDRPLVYFDPESKTYETRDSYLSGQVKRKLAAARDAGMESNIRALEEVQPPKIESENIGVTLGASWVPESVYNDFLAFLGVTAKVRYLAATNSYSVEKLAEDSVKSSDWAVTGEGGYPIAGVTTLVTDALNSRSTTITYRDSDGNVHIDRAGTALAAIKRKEIDTAFRDWVMQDADRRALLVDIFNEKFNVRVNRQHDGSHLTLPGKVPDHIIKMRRHQNNAIWRGISERFMLIDHVVGAGKTFTAIARAMERRRMGLSRKPMIVVPNHLVEQWASDVYRLYPAAKVFAMTKRDLEKRARRRSFAKIATGDWDVVIVPHSSFKFIPIAPETELRYLDAELKLAQEAIKEAQEVAKEDGLDTGRRKPFNVKQAEQLAEKIEGRIKALRTSKQDKLLTFEQMGVDDLTVDEAHEFKNLFYSSRLTKVRGMGDKSGSQKAFDLYNKARVLRDSPTGSVVFMTGTPISNSAVEMYTMMRYLAADELRELGLEHFDAWRAQSVSVSTAWEPNESGRLEEVNRLGREWDNMRTLMDLYYSFTDAVTQEDIQKWYREDNKGAEYPIPRVKGGFRKEVVVKPTPEQSRILEAVIAGFDGLKNISDPDERNAERLRLMDRARKVSLDARLVERGLQSDETGGKLDRVADEVARIYKQWDADAGTQLVFLDRGLKGFKGDEKLVKEYDALIEKRDRALAENDEAAYRDAVEAIDKFDANEVEEMRAAAGGGWNAYDQLRDNLIARGIKPEEIRFVQDAQNDAQKKALFDAVNDGDVRVLIGSTPKMGAGTNVQERLVALHHVDVTWKPSDIEQREGRIIRQGNSLLEKYGLDKFEVEILAYVTERTVDAKLWSLNATKLKMINGIRKYDGAFTAEFEDEDSVSMAEIAALASGNPLLLERVKLTSELDRLDMQRRAFVRKVRGAQDRIANAERILRDYPPRITDLSERAAEMKGRVRAMMDAAEARTVTIEGKTYSNLFDASKAWTEEMNRQKGGNENARYSINVDGNRLTSKDAIENAVEHALGDVVPFEATIGGARVIRRSDAAKTIAQMAANAAAAGGNTFPIGTMLGYDLVGVVTPARWGPGSSLTLALEKDGRTVASYEGRPVEAFSPANTRAAIEKLEVDISSTASWTDSWMRAEMRRAEEGLPTYRKQAAETWNLAAEYQAKQDRLEEVVRLLSDKKQETPEQPPEALENRALEAKILPFFRELYAGEPDLDATIRNTLDLLPFEPDVTIERVALPERPTTPLRYTLATRTIEYNTASPYHSLALDVQGMLEEQWHSADHVGNRVLSAGMTRLLPGGDLHAELREAMKKSAMLDDFLIYPLDVEQFPNMTAMQRQAEVFARLGVFYTAHRDVLARVAPKITEAYDYATGWTDRGLHGAQGAATAAGDRVLRALPAGRLESGRGGAAVQAAGGYRAGGLAAGRDQVGVRGDVRGSLAGQPTDRLAEFRRRSAETFGGSVAEAGTLPQALETRVTEGALADAWPIAAQRAHDAVFDALTGGKTFNVWQRTVGTQMDKARTSPEFRRVFERAQKFLDDIAKYGMRAEGLAPSILPKVGGLKDVPNAVLQAVGKAGMSSADNEWLARTLADGTLAGVDPSPLQGKVFTDVELEKAGATPQQIKLYREARAAIDQAVGDAGRATMFAAARAANMPQSMIDWLEQTQPTPAAVRQKIADWTAPQIDQAQAVAERQFEQAKADLEAEMEYEVEQYPYPSDKINVKAKYWDRIERARRAAFAPVEALKKLDERLAAIEAKATALQSAGYAPLMRFGKFYLTAYAQTSGEPTVEYFGKFDSRAELLRERRRLEAENPEWDFRAGELSTEAFKLYEGVDPATVLMFAREAGLQDEALQKWYELAVAERSALKRMIHRQGTPGYSLDAKRSLAAFLTSNARYVSNTVNAAEMTQAAKDVRDGGVQDEAVKLVEYVLKPQEEAAAIRGMLFTWYLGGSLAAGLVNLSQPFLMTLPYLARFGAGNAAKALKEGMAAAFASMRGKPIGDADLADAMARAAAAGRTDPSEIHALMAASRGEFQTPLLQAVHTVWGANFAVTEAINRKTTFAAAYIAARAAGEPNPYQFAMQAVYDTQGLYSRANRPNWARGTIGSTVFTFKQFSIAYIEFLKQLAKEGKLPKEQLAVALGMLVLASGLQGLPGADDLDDVIDALGQWLGYATNVRQSKRQLFEAALGKTLGNIALYGVSTQLGLDLSSRLGMGNLIPGTGALIPANPNKGRDLIEFVGPLGSLVSNGAGATERLFHGNFGGAAQAVAPTALRNVYKGGEMLVTGEARDDRGRRVNEVSPAAAVTKAVGFNPNVIAEEGRRMREIRYDENIVNSKAAEIRELWATGVARNDMDRVREAQEMLRQWNADNPAMAIRVRPQDVMRRAKDMRRSRSERFVRSVPESLRARARAAVNGEDEGDEE